MKERTEAILKEVTDCLQSHGLPCEFCSTEKVTLVAQVNLEDFTLSILVGFDERETELRLQVEIDKHLPPEKNDRILDLLNQINDRFTYVGTFSVPQESGPVISRTAIPIPEGHFNIAHFSATLEEIARRALELSALVSTVISTDLTPEGIVQSFIQAAAQRSSNYQVH